MTLSERIHRFLVWAGVQLCPRSPVFNRDEAMARMQLYSTEKRGVRKTPKKSDRTVSAAGRSTQRSTDSLEYH